MKEKLSAVGIVFIAVVVISGIIYGSYWVVKTASYNIFYEDMVKQTIIEYVNPECLNK